MKPYEPAFSVGSKVRVVDTERLKRFKKTWKFHNPLSVEQLAFAGKTAEVAKVGFYHGGDPLYVLEEIPGVWHEECLEGRATAMRKTFADLPGWHFDVDEVSAGVYEVIGRDTVGHCVSEKGTDPDAILEDCKREAQKISESQR